MEKAVLLLEDGTVYHGTAAGIKGIATGEICFNTGMTGYQEIFTDPSYFGQIMVTTNVHIGNYGVKNKEAQSENVKINGLVCRSFNEKFSRPLADDSIQAYFEANNTVAISDVDTRSIVKKIRQEGAMNALISSDILDVEELKKRLAAVPNMKGLELASQVSTKAPYYMGDPHDATKVAVIDFGVKTSILECMAEEGIYMKIFPGQTDFAEVTKWNPDGIFLSNGPGDPSAMDYAVSFTEQVLKEDIPVFGICLGHQILALAMGLTTYKMKHGHRGLNHPVKNLTTGKCEITSQNHGFGVDADSIRSNPDIEITHINLNDDTVEGIKVKNRKAFSVQYHPEASPGPHDARYLFLEFKNLMQAIAIA